MSDDSRETQRKFTEAIEELADTISKLKNEDKTSHILGNRTVIEKFCNWWSMVKVWASCVKWTNNKVQSVAILSHFKGKAVNYAHLLMDQYTTKENHFKQDKDGKLTTILYGTDAWPTANNLEYEIRKHYQIQVLIHKSYKELPTYQQNG